MSSWENIQFCSFFQKKSRFHIFIDVFDQHILASTLHQLSIPSEEKILKPKSVYPWQLIDNTLNTYKGIIIAHNIYHNIKTL
jgi:hypothetical protein